MTFFELMERFPTELSIIDYYIRQRYTDGATCPHCGCKHVYQRRNSRAKVFDCQQCHNTFSIFTGTIFYKSSTDLRKWIYTIHMFISDKKGCSGKQIQRETGVTYKTAWRLLQQIRKAMGNQLVPEFVRTVIEMDETYIGGKPRHKNVSKRGRGTGKTPVVGMADRHNSKIHARVMLPNKRRKRLSGTQLIDALKEIVNVTSGSNVVTDEFKGYKNIRKDTGVLHDTVNHKKTYVDGWKHTNTIEGFWSWVKRSIYGVYHHVSEDYLQRYIDEIVFRYNNRSHQDQFGLLIRQTVGVV